MNRVRMESSIKDIDIRYVASGVECSDHVIMLTRQLSWRQVKESEHARVRT